MSRWLPSLAAASLVALAPFAASSEIQIDTFSTPQALEVLLAGPDVVAGSIAAPEAIGGERDVELERLSGGNSVQFESGVEGIERMACSAGAGTAGFCLVIWDGPDGSAELDPSGLAGIDLTQGGVNDAFHVSVQSDLPVTMAIQVVQNGGLSVVSAELDLPGGDEALVPRYLPISSFSGGPDVFTDVGAILFSITGPAGFDALVDDVRFTVPEPSGLLAGLVAWGMLLPLRARRRA